MNAHRPPALEQHERIRAAGARDAARRLYPGPIAEVLDNEISAYLKFGYRFARDGLVPRLVDELMKTPPPAGAPALAPVPAEEAA